MLVKPKLLWIWCVPWWLAAIAPAGAQTVYKCPSRGAVLYSEKPCAGRIISTEQAPVNTRAHASNADVRRIEESRLAARALRRRPDESAEQFAVRKRRAAMLPQDRAECARLDTRMPVEQATMANPDPAEVAKAQSQLDRSRQRFSQLHC